MKGKPARTNGRSGDVSSRALRRSHREGEVDEQIAGMEDVSSRDLRHSLVEDDEINIQRIHAVFSVVVSTVQEQKLPPTAMALSYLTMSSS